MCGIPFAFRNQFDQRCMISTAVNILLLYSKFIILLLFLLSIVRFWSIEDFYCVVHCRNWVLFTHYFLGVLCRIAIDNGQTPVHEITDMLCGLMEHSSPTSKSRGT